MKKWLNIKNKNRFAFKRTPVKESREHDSSDRFKNVTCERDRRRKLILIIKLLQILAVENAKTRMYERVMLVLQDGRKKFINQYRRKITN